MFLFLFIFDFNSHLARKNPDAIISAIPDRDFKGELYTQFGHVGSLPGPTASGVSEEFSVKSIFDFIRAHIVCIKQKGLTDTVNKNSGFFVSTPQTQRKFGGQRSFSGQSHPRAQAVDFHSEFPLSDRNFQLLHSYKISLYKIK
jgi:hypothetical protein